MVLAFHCVVFAKEDRGRGRLIPGTVEKIARRVPRGGSLGFTDTKWRPVQALSGME